MPRTARYDDQHVHQRTLSHTTRINIPPSNRDERSTSGRSGAQAWGWAEHSSRSHAAGSTGRSRPFGPSGQVENGRIGTWLQQRHIARRILVITALSVLLLYYVLAPSHTSHTPKAYVKPKTANDVPERGVPVIDKKVLKKLDLLNRKYAPGDEDEIEQRMADRLPANNNPNSPPIIHAAPEGKIRPKYKVATSEDTGEKVALQPAEEIDAQYCPDQERGCQFLLAAWLGEQETKAQQHLYQLGLLAVSLNRTLVLPNVSKSRMMSCAASPFEFYYDAQSLDKLGIPSISFSRFSEWTAKRKGGSSAQIVTVTSKEGLGGASSLDVHHSLDPRAIPAAPSRGLCLDKPRTFLEFVSYSPITLTPPSGWHKEPESRFAFGEFLVQSLRSEDTLLKSFRRSEDSHTNNLPPTPEVLVFNYELRYPILSPEHIVSLASSSAIPVVHPFAHFDYSPIWTSLAHQLVSQLAPFIVIHWRQETLPPSVIEPCGVSLIDHLEELLNPSLPSGGQYSKIRTVYLATDYPIEDLENNRENVLPHSGTFAKSLTEEHHRAMQRFLKAFKTRLTDPLEVELTTLSKEEDHLMLPPELSPLLGGQEKEDRGGALNLAELDPGLLGIVDKVVAMNAQLFLTGKPHNARAKQDTGCAKESSFTKQIIEKRRRTWVDVQEGSDSSPIWNDVSYWSRGGQVE